MPKRGVSIVISANNEEKSLPTLLKQLKNLQRNFPPIREIIIVDNGSTDRTFEIAKKFCRAVRNTAGGGKGAGLRFGFKHARNDIIVTMDADLSHIPSDIKKLVKPLLNNRKIGLVIGSRSLGGSEEFTLVRAVGNVLITGLCNFLLGLNLTDALNGFKAFRHEIADSLSADSFDIEIEIIGNCLKRGYKIIEVPSHEVARKFGSSHLKAITGGLILIKQIIIEYLKLTFL